MNDEGGLDADALAYYADGAWYDAEYGHLRYDVPYYVSIAADATASGGRALELACGTGRLTLPIAQAGAPVLGVDLVAPMIEEAERKASRLPPADRSRLEFRVGDMRRLALGERFPAIILAFNTLMHMVEDADLEAVLGTVREHLADDGVFHFDFHTPFPSVDVGDPPRSEPQELIEPRTRRRFLLRDSHRYDPRRQLNTMTFHYQEVDQFGRPMGPETVRELRLRVIFPRELDRWLYLAGFEVVGDWDDFGRSKAFSGRGGRRIVAARRR